MMTTATALWTVMNNKRYTKKFRAMGTTIEIDIVGGEKSEERIVESLHSVARFFHDTEERFSRFRDASELQFVNAHVGAYVHVSTVFLDVLAQAVMYYHASHGVFDPRVYDALVHAGYNRDLSEGKFTGKCTNEGLMAPAPVGIMRDEIVIDRAQGTVYVARHIDLTGIVKGWAVDQARALICDKVAGYIIDAGGDMWVHGVDENGQTWYIGIEDTEEDHMLLKITDEGIATSGITRRQWHSKDGQRHHLIDPKQQESFSFALATVTVIASTVTDADVWAKVLFIKGLEKGVAYANAHNIKAIFIDLNHAHYVSHTAKKYLV